MNDNHTPATRWLIRANEYFFKGSSLNINDYSLSELEILGEIHFDEIINRKDTDSEHLSDNARLFWLAVAFACWGDLKFLFRFLENTRRYNETLRHFCKDLFPIEDFQSFYWTKQFRQWLGDNKDSLIWDNQLGIYTLK